MTQLTQKLELPYFAWHSALGRSKLLQSEADTGPGAAVGATRAVVAGTGATVTGAGAAVVTGTGAAVVLRFAVVAGAVGPEFPTTLMSEQLENQNGAKSHIQNTVY